MQNEKPRKPEGRRPSSSNTDNTYYNRTIQKLKDNKFITYLIITSFIATFFATIFNLVSIPKGWWGSKATVDTPTHTLQTTLNETFEKKFKSYLAATISGDDTSKLSEREKYRIIDMIYADTMLHLLVLHTTDTIGKTWADGKHYKSSAFVFGIKKDKTIQSLCLLNDLYMEHGAMADSNGYILAFINFKTDAESKDFMWKGDICRIPPDMGDYSVCSVFEDTLNGGFYPYFIGDTVVHFNFAGRYVFENDRKASLPVNNILSGKQRAVEHMKNYAMAVVAHSNGFIKNNIDDNNYSDMFAKIKKWASR